MNDNNINIKHCFVGWKPKKKKNNQNEQKQKIVIPLFLPTGWKSRDDRQLTKRLEQNSKNSKMK